MKTETDVYSNPRIDRPDIAANAQGGIVHADAAKIAWLGPMLLGGTIGSAVTITMDAAVLFLVSTIVTLCLGHSLGMHRRFIHKSYECPKWMEYLFVHLGVLVGLAGPFGMMRTHDTRDWAQRQSRCHDYYSHGQVWYRDLWWQLCCSISLPQPPDIEIEPEYANDRIYRFMESTWMVQQLPWAVLFYWLGGWGWVFWGICSRVSVSVLGHWMIGYFAHNTGSRSWHVSGAAVQGYNVPWCALLTMGESWHNNHHAFPGSARLGLEDGQWDPGWWLLLAMERVGWVDQLVTPETMAVRSELLPVHHPSQDASKTLRVSTTNQQQA